MEWSGEDTDEDGFMEVVRKGKKRSRQTDSPEQARERVSSAAWDIIIAKVKKLEELTVTVINTKVEIKKAATNLLRTVQSLRKQEDALDGICANACKGVCRGPCYESKHGFWVEYLLLETTASMRSQPTAGLVCSCVFVVNVSLSMTDSCHRGLFKSLGM